MVNIFNWFRSTKDNITELLDSLPDKNVKPENDDMILHTIEMLRSKGYIVLDYSSGRLRAKLNLVYIVLSENELIEKIPEGFTREKQGTKLYIYMVPEGDSTSIQKDILINNLRLLNWAANLPDCTSATEITHFYHEKEKRRRHAEILESMMEDKVKDIIEFLSKKGYLILTYTVNIGGIRIVFCDDIKLPNSPEGYMHCRDIRSEVIYKSYTNIKSDEFEIKIDEYNEYLLDWVTKLPEIKGRI